MKRLATIRIAMLMLFAAAGCGSASDGGTVSSSDASREASAPTGDASSAGDGPIDTTADGGASIDATPIAMEAQSISSFTALTLDGHATTLVGLANGRAARWTATTDVVPFAVAQAGEDTSRATAVSADGTIAAGTSTMGTSSASVLWSDPATPHLLGFAHAGDSVSEVVALSDDGSTVVATSGGPQTSPLEMSAFVWKNGVTTLIPPLSGDRGISPVVMSADGSTVAGSSWNVDLPRVFVWTAAAGTTEVTFDIAATGSRFARALSADGSVLVGAISPNAASDQDTPQRVFRWTRAAGTTYVTPADAHAAVAGVTADGALVAGSIGLALFVSTDAGFVTLPFPQVATTVTNLTVDRGGSLLLGSTGGVLNENDLLAWTISSQGLAPLSLPYIPSISTGIPVGVSVDGRTFVATGGGTTDVFTLH